MPVSTTPQPISVVYDGVEIVYSEGENVWNFELRGRSRKADSLLKAKEIIDKPAPNEKTFQRTKAYYENYREGYVLVDVTSIAEPRSYDRRTTVWISLNGKREKTVVDSLIAVTPENEKTMAEINALRKQAEELSEKARELHNQMTRFQVK